MAYEIDSGYKTIFKTATPPVNWTKDTSYNDHTFRVVTGAASSGGTVDFSSVFANITLSVSNTVTGSLGAVALTNTQIATHTHYHQYVTTGFSSTANASAPTWSIATGSTPITSSVQGADDTHTHPYTGSVTFTPQINGSVSVVDMRVKYVDTIIAVRD